MRLSTALVCLGWLAGAGYADAQVAPYWNAQWGGPQGASLGLGLRVGRTDGESLKITKRALLIEARPGVDGGAFHLGYVPISGSTHGLQFAGVALKGTLLRTWGSPGGTLLPQTTYAGGELHVAWVVKGSVGVLWRVSGGSSDSRVVTFSVGVGL